MWIIASRLVFFLKFYETKSLIHGHIRPWHPRMCAQSKSTWNKWFSLIITSSLWFLLKIYKNQSLIHGHFQTNTSLSVFLKVLCISIKKIFLRKYYYSSFFSYICYTKLFLFGLEENWFKCAWNFWEK